MAKCIHVLCCLYLLFISTYASNGDDVANNGSATSPFATMNKVWSVAAANFDIDVTVFVQTDMLGGANESPPTSPALNTVTIMGLASPGVPTPTLNTAWQLANTSQSMNLQQLTFSNIKWNGAGLLQFVLLDSFSNITLQLLGCILVDADNTANPVIAFTGESLTTTLILRNTTFDNMVVQSLFAFTSSGNASMMMDGCQFTNIRAGRMTDMSCSKTDCSQSVDLLNSSFEYNEGNLFQINNTAWTNGQIHVTMNNSSFLSQTGAVLKTSTDFAANQVLSVVNSTFSSVSSDFGGVFSLSNPSTTSTITISLTDSHFIGCSANTGGVFWISAASSVVSLSSSQTSFNDSTVAFYGGSFYIEAKQFTMDMNHVTHDDAIASSGGFLYLRQSYGGTSANINLIDVHFQGNKESIISSDGLNTTLTMVDCYVYFHDGSNPSFELAAQYLTVVVNQSRFENNTNTLFSLKGLLSSAEIRLQATDNIWNLNQVTLQVLQGGGCFSLTCGSTCNQTVELSKNTFLNNSHPANGGVLAMFGSPTSALDQSLTFNNNTWRGNQAKTGGCVYLEGSPGRKTILVDLESVVENQALLGDGGFLALSTPASQVTVTLFHSQFTGNAANGMGGVVSVSGCSSLVLTVDGCEMADSQAISGGVLYAQGNMFTANTHQFCLLNSQFYRNKATHGGGILGSNVQLGTQELTVYNSVLQDNTATNHGGVLILSATNNVAVQSVNIAQNVIRGGSATFGGILSFEISGVMNPIQSIHLQDNSVTNTNAISHGGFAYMFITKPAQLDLTVTNNRFQNTSAGLKGAIFFITHGATQSNHSITANGNHWLANTAMDGAVVWFEGPETVDLSLQDNIFEDHNTATSLIALTAKQCIVHASNNTHTNNTHASGYLWINAMNYTYLVSNGDQINQPAGNWLWLSVDELDNLISYNQTVEITDLTAHFTTTSSPTPWHLIHMIGTTDGQQSLSLLNVSITASLDTSEATLVTMTCNEAVTQQLSVTDSLISNIRGGVFDLAGTTSSNQSVSFRNTTMKQVSTLDSSSALKLVTSGTQVIDWSDSMWEECQATASGGILLANNMTELNVTNCQFKKNTVSSGGLFAVHGNPAGSETTFQSNYFFQNQVGGSVIQLNNNIRSRFVNHTVVEDTPLHLWVTNDTSQVDFAEVYATYSSSNPLLAKWEVSEAANMSLGSLELTFLNATSNVTLLNYAIQPQAWTSMVVKHVNTTRGCFNGYQVLYNASHATAQLNSVSCPALDIPSDSTGNVTVTGIVVLYANQTLNVSTGVHIQVEEGGCLLLEGDLHLRVDESALPDSQPALIEGCIDGQFGNVTFDNTNNPQICQVSPIYASSQVLMNLQACDNPIVEPPTVPVGAIVGGVVGGVVFVALVVALTVYLVKRHQRKQMARKLSAKLDKANNHKKNRKTLGPESIQNASYDNEGRRGENVIYQ